MTMLTPEAGLRIARSLASPAPPAEPKPCERGDCWLHSRCMGHCIEGARPAATPVATPAGSKVWLVATGQAYGARETYTRHEVRPPLCDAELLYTAPPPLEPKP